MLIALRPWQRALVLVACSATLMACGESDDSAQASAAPPTAGPATVQPNVAPEISGTPATVATQGQPYTFDAAASDANGDSLTFSISNMPPWASFNTSTGTLSGNPTSGTFSDIVISVSDGTATSTLPAFTITVQPPAAGNSPPTISGTPATTATEGQAYSFQPIADDDDGDTLTFSITGRPGWASFNTGTGRLSGTPTSQSIRTYSNIVIRVSDGTVTSALPAFSITVSAAPVSNNAPTISGTPPPSVLAGQPYTFTPVADDDDGDNLDFGISGLPAWASFDGNSGRLSGTPSAADVRTYDNIVISVTDGAAMASLGPFSIAVVAVATGSATLSWQAPTQNSDGSALTDLAGFKVYWGTAQGNYPNSATLSNPGITTYVVEPLTPATWYFVTTAVNGQGYESASSNVATKTVTAQ